jgi:hypothetical protein
MHLSPTELILLLVLVVLLASRFAPPQAWWRAWANDSAIAGLVLVIVLLVLGLLW